MASILTADWLPLLLTAAAMLLLAGGLLWVDPGRVVNRVFAAILSLRATAYVIGGPLRDATDTEANFLFYNSLGPYLFIPMVPLLLYFLSVYPHRRGVFGTTRWGPWALLAFTFAALFWYLLDHSAYAATVLTPPGYLSLAGPGHMYTDYGPLILFNGLRAPAFAFAAVVLAKDYANNPRGSVGYSRFLIYAGFALNSLFNGVLRLDRFYDLTVGGYRFEWWPWGWAHMGLPVITLPLVLASLYYVNKARKVEAKDATAQEARRFLTYAVPLPLLSGIFVILAFRILPFTETLSSVLVFVLGIWRLVIPFLVTYALLRFGLFDFDIKIKASVRRAIIMVAFTMTFFLVSEAAENLIASGRSTLFGIIAAGTLALFAKPVEAFSSRAADAMMPDTKPIEQKTRPERMAFYLEQYDLVQEDQSVTDKERRMLTRLAKALDLSASEVRSLEKTRQVPEEDAADEAMRIRAREAATKDGDSRFEVIVRAGLVAGSLALIFGMVSEGLESLVDLGSFGAGLVTAAVFSLLLGPVESLADRLADRLFPNAQSAADDKRRFAVYREAVEEALADGTLSKKDRTYLGYLQDNLGIKAGQRRAIENEVRAARRDAEVSNTRTTASS